MYCNDSVSHHDFVYFFRCSQEMQYQFSPISTNESLLSVSSDKNAEFEKRKETDEAEDTFKLSVYFESANIRNDTFVFLKHVKGVKAMQCE